MVCHPPAPPSPVKKPNTVVIGLARSGIESLQLRQSLPYWDYQRGKYISEIMQWLSNHDICCWPTHSASHCSLCNIVSCPDLSWGKGSGDYWVLSCSWLCQVSSLNFKQANKIMLRHKEVIIHLFKNQDCSESLAQPRKHSIVTRPFSSWEDGVWGQDYWNWECHRNICYPSSALFILSHTDIGQICNLAAVRAMWSDRQYIVSFHWLQYWLHWRVQCIMCIQQSGEHY